MGADPADVKGRAVSASDERGRPSDIGREGGRAPWAKEGLSALLSRFRLRACEALGDAPRVLGKVYVRGGGRVFIGDRVFIDGGEAPIELHAYPRAEIHIGDDVRIGPGTSLEALGSITVGDCAVIGPYCKVLDSHHHALQPKPGAGHTMSPRGDHSRPPPEPVVIERDAVIGARAILLPGARVARGAIVAAGAVLSRSGRRAPAGPVRAEEPPRPGMKSRHRLCQLCSRTWRLLLAWLYCGRAAVGKRVFATGRVRVKNRGKIVLGRELQLLGGMIPSELTCHRGATLEIGPDGLFNYGVSIEAANQVRIGSRCMLGSFVRISDRDGSGCRPITIGERVWIAHGAVIHPGVTIGDGSVISAGSDVTVDVPADHVAVGKPARVVPIKFLASDGRSG
jgi:acetyltransferase-like isoleucine patch superfamily enzyme